MCRVTVVTPPDAVLSVADAKAHLRVEHADEDDYIEACVAAATGHIDGPDGWLGRCIGLQTLELRQDRFDGDILLPYPPIVEVEGVSYVGTDQVEQDLDSGEYEAIGTRVVLAYAKAWPSTSGQPESVRVRYVAGYETIPPAILAAIKLMVGDLYGQRESVAVGGLAPVDMSVTVQRLLAPFRDWR